MDTDGTPNATTLVGVACEGADETEELVCSKREDPFLPQLAVVDLEYDGEKQPSLSRICPRFH